MRADQNQTGMFTFISLPDKGSYQTVRIMDHNAAHFTFGPEHDKTNKMTCARSEDSEQSGHQSGHRMPTLI